MNNRLASAGLMAAIAAAATPAAAQERRTDTPARQAPGQGATAAEPRPGAPQEHQQTEAEPRPGTVAWFLRNPDARRAAVARCEDDPGRLRATPECVNALEARDRAFFDTPDLPTTGGRRF